MTLPKLVTLLMLPLLVEINTVILVSSLLLTDKLMNISSIIKELISLLKVQTLTP